MTAMNERRPVAVVTGGAKGIGAAICDALIADGYLVAAVDIAATAKQDHLAGYVADISDLAALIATLEKIEAEHGLVRVLVNNAGILSSKTLFELTPETFDRTMAINLRPVIFASQHVARRLIAKDCPGSIVNVASSAGRFGSIWPDYGTSKAGVIGATLSLAKALADKQIRVNAVAPGQVVTDMNAEMSPQQRAINSARIGMKRPADPSEIADVVAFLAGDRASFVTGSVIDANGGRF
jgi:NAD(P)-dependent dehydrogenase (short-subunit alcohol dehydrogenase family)